MRSFLAIAYAEAHLLARCVLVPCAVLAVLYSGLAFVQEPSELVVLGLVFAGESVDALLCLCAAGLPLVWLLLREREGLAWEWRASPMPAIDAIARSAGIFATGALTLGLMSLVSITAERIHGGTPSLTEALSGWSRSTLVVLPLAAIAPAVGSLLTGVPAAVLGWSLLLAASAGAFGPGVPVPIDRVLEPAVRSAMPGAGTLAAMVLSTAGGLLLSAGLARGRLGRARIGTGLGQSPAAETRPRW